MLLVSVFLLLAGIITQAAGLSQRQTNGNSLWGTLEAPSYAHYLNNGLSSTTLPWGTRTVNNTNPYANPPTTGVTRYYTFNVSRALASPDGYQKHMIMINDQFPGPLIEANWGDTIQVTVNNFVNDPDEGTTIHWHGLLQKKTPWYDGVPGVTQCPIPPNGTFTYRFQADLYGSSWYHSHFSAQYADGAFGPMVIHGPTKDAYDIDLGPIILSDWFHKPYFQVIEAVSSTNSSQWLQYSDNNLINGKGNYNCSLVTDGTPCEENAGLAKFKFKSGKSHLLRLINTSGAGMERFSIDDHNLTVIANDFVPVVPYNATYVTLGVGQRTDVIVHGTGPSNGVYWMRSNISEICNLPRQPFAKAVIYYEDADTDATPNSTASYYPGDDGSCDNDPLEKTIPYYPISLPTEPSTTETINIDEVVNKTGHLVWTINKSSARIDYNEAVYLLSNQGNISYPYNPEWNFYDFFDNSSVRIVLNNLHKFSHPIHLHGHNIFVLHDGDGAWDGKSIVRPENPQRRDTQMLRGNGHLVIQYNTDNPGTWPLHCHIAWHVSMGFYMTVVEKPGNITKSHPPQNVWDTCTQWDDYTKNHIVDQIDSGV